MMAALSPVSPAAGKILKVGKAACPLFGRPSADAGEGLMTA
jgi:hypothetical protein